MSLIPSAAPTVGTPLRQVVTMLIVVRHAVAVDRAEWSGSDLRRPLTPLGERQAEGLVLRLDDYPVERILSSPAQRCLQTVAPLARQRLLPVEPFPALGLDSGVDRLLDVIGEAEVCDAVLCGHGEMIGEILFRLIRDGGFEAPEPQWPKGSTWLLQRLGRGRVSGRYLPPLAYDPNLWPSTEHDPGGRVWGSARQATGQLTLREDLP
jgi:phosphohistidine phosphatase SixA